MIDLVTFSVKKGDDLWEATVKVTGDQRSVSAVAKMLSALTYIIRANPLQKKEPEPEVDTGLCDVEKRLKKLEKHLHDHPLARGSILGGSYQDLSGRKG